ncbi:MAG TPA: four helix bundle protein [Haliscomenobacter sp.]|nr:four helix bundle protein [Haliscomenobacter sp.]HOY21037.1 four helix bundle protein [Haliscomenobacter sp.]HPH18881.1 four helix bundle protein [Haliscomenobacter sp.]
MIASFCIIILQILERYIWGIFGSVIIGRFIHFAEKIEPMAYTYGFEKLKVWQNSIALVKTIYCCTRNFPNEEKFGITSQIRRSSLSVPTNISEGVSRKTPKDQAHFTTIAYSSLTETLNLLIIAKELSLMNEDDYARCRKQVEEVSFLLNNLRKSQQP